MNFDEQYACYTSGEKKINELYHRIAAQNGISDSVLSIFLCLYDETQVHTQNTIAIRMGVPKQTINSAINKLMKDGYIYLEQMSIARNKKQIMLTKNGKQFCDRYIAPIVIAEENAFNRLSVEEQEAYLSIGIKFNQFMVEEMSELISKKQGDDNE